tara:strand:+ start:2216 stop:5569 length:3354 start_codon:yes stop_codon:yes gene_type:complete
LILKRNTTLLLVFIFNSFVSGSKTFDRLTVREGLSENIVHSVADDKRGFIWIGTDEGLNRYDGYEPVIYRSNPFDTTALSGNRVFGLFKDSEGDIWASTDKSLDLYKYGKNTFRRHATESRPVFVTEDTLGNIWVASKQSGVFKINKITGKTKNYRFSPLDPTSISSNNFDENQKAPIVIDKDQNLWVGTKNGLNYFQKKKDVFVRLFSLQGSSNSLSSNNINTLYLAGEDLWVGTPAGLDRVNTKTMTVERYAGAQWLSMVGIYSVTKILPFKNGTPMSGFWLATIGGLVYYDENMTSFQDVIHPDIFGRYVADMYDDPQGNLWLSIPQTGGLIHFNTTNFYLMYGFTDPDQDFQHIINDPVDPQSISGNKIHSVFFDQKENTWIATNKGINKLAKTKNLFMPFSGNQDSGKKVRGKEIKHIETDKNNEIWLSHENGLDHINNSGDVLANYVSDPTNENSLLTRETGVFEILANNDIWVASEHGGLTILNPEEKSFSRHEHDPEKEKSIIGGKIESIYEDATGTVWLSSLRGVCRYKDKEFKSFLYNQELRNNHLSGVTAILEDSQGQFWLGTGANGLYRVNKPDMVELEHYKLDPNDRNSFASSVVLTIHEDKNKNLWIGSGGEGLFKYNRNKNNFTRITIENGLPSNTIVSIKNDNDGFLWMGTRNGIARLNPDMGLIQGYNRSDGLNSRIFYGGAIAAGKYGKMYFGGPAGAVVVNPLDIKPNSEKPLLAITGIIGFDKSNLKTIVDFSTGKIEIDHKTQTLQIDFVGLSFNKSEKNNYRYILVNQQENWIENGTSRRASFQGLVPGEYKFIFMASNNDGVWSEESERTTIIVRPPAWKTWWAYSGYIGLLAITAFGAVRKRDKIQLARIEQIRRTEELEEARSFQLKMLPKECPKLLDLDIAATIETATEVGGDYYDFFPQKNDKSVYVVVGDATGHGMTAGMMVSITKAGLYGTQPNIPPNEISYGLNRVIKAFSLGKTKMAISIARFWEDKVEFTSAAMPPIYHYHGETGKTDEILLEGLPLGSIKGETYSQVEIGFKKKDVFVFISDGLPEATNLSEQMLGYKAVLNCVRENGSKSAEEIKQVLLDMGKAWLGDLRNQDDITIVVVKKN